MSKKAAEKQTAVLLFCETFLTPKRMYIECNFQKSFAFNTRIKFCCVSKEKRLR